MVGLYNATTYNIGKVILIVSNAYVPVTGRKQTLVHFKLIIRKIRGVCMHLGKFYFACWRLPLGKPTIQLEAGEVRRLKPHSLLYSYGHGIVKVRS